MEWSEAVASAGVEVPRLEEIEFQLSRKWVTDLSETWARTMIMTTIRTKSSFKY